MKKPWFDAENGLLRLDEMALESPTFQNIMKDGVVTDEELLAQGRLASSLLRELDEKLPPALHALAGKALVELAVLHAVQVRHYSQKEG